MVLERNNGKGRRILIGAVIAALIVAMSTGGFLFAKYISEKQVTGKVKVSAELASSIEIFEHEAVDTVAGGKVDYGSYSLNPDKEVSVNEYVLMPGVDIPKDPTVRVTGFTGLAAYLYVEVIEEGLSDAKMQTTAAASPVTYEIADGWTLLKDTNDTAVEGKHGGKVYYRALGADDVPASGSENKTKLYKILKNDTVTVSDRLKHEPGTGGTAVWQSSALSFYAAIVQKAGEDPAAAYTAIAGTAQNSNNNG